MNGEVVFIRTSERRSYKTCRQQHWWAYNDRLTAKVAKPALRLGDLVHQALAIWYKPGRKRGVHPAKSFERLYNEELERGMSEFSIRLDEDEEWADALELGIEMLKHYVERWGKDEHIEVIAPELPFQVALYDRNGDPLLVRSHDGRLLPAVYVGKLDLAYRDLNNDQVGIMETKTAKSIRKRHLQLDEQAGSYWVMGPTVLQDHGALKAGQDLDFILYNFLRKAKPDQRPQNDAGQYLNKDGSVSKSQPPLYFEREKVWRGDADRENLMYRIRNEAWEIGQVRSGKLPVYKNPGGSWPNEQCNGCEFNDICVLHEMGSDWEELRDLSMTSWDPYEDHSDYDHEEH